MVFRPAESNFCFNMKHSFLLAALIFAGQVLGGDVELNLGTLEGSGLISYGSGESATGVVIGSNSKTGGVVADSSVVHGATYSTLTPILSSNLTWYSNVGSTTDGTNITGINAVDGAATIVTDGPGGTSRVSAAAFAYTLTSSVISTLDTSKSITLSFKISVSGGNNNYKTQSIEFGLLSSAGSADSVSYTNTNGTNTAETEVTLTLSSAMVQLLAQPGDDQTIADQKLIFIASDSSITAGTNEAFTIKNINLKYSTTVPEPGTATLSLIALAGLCSRRRRKM